MQNNLLFIIWRFLFTKTSGLNFRQLPVAKGTAFSKISRKEDNLASYTQLFEKFFPEVFFPFNFAPGISRIFGEMVRISEIKQFLDFLETFSWNFWTICRFFQIFERFGWVEITQLYPSVAAAKYQLLVKSC